MAYNFIQTCLPSGTQCSHLNIRNKRWGPSIRVAVSNIKNFCPEMERGKDDLYIIGKEVTF